MDGAHESAPHALLGRGAVYADVGFRNSSSRCTRSKVGVVLCGLSFFKLSDRTSCYGTALTRQALATCNKPAWRNSGKLHISHEPYTCLPIISLGAALL